MIARLRDGIASAGAMAIVLGAILFFIAGPYLVYEVFPVQAYRLSEALAFIAFIVGLVFALIAIVPKARPTSGLVLVAASFVIAMLLWVWSVILVGDAWGLGALYFLNLFLGVGAVLGAFVATLLGGNWHALIQLIVIAVIVLVFRMIGTALSVK